jgi:hypothetical protein
MCRVLFGLVALAAVAACRDLSGFSTHGNDSYQGPVVGAGFVLAGMKSDAVLCLTLDTDHLEDTPGAISTMDGMFRRSPLRPIPQIWHDPLSTLSFGEGRLRNLVYVASTTAGDDVFAVVSLMQSGNIEVRLLRGAPDLAPARADGGSTQSAGGNLFAIFSLEREEVPCSF